MELTLKNLDPATVQALKLVVKELEAARHKHPAMPIEPLPVIAILSEEVGEAAKEAVDLTWHGKKNPKDFYKELAQVAVVCIRGLSSVPMSYLSGMSPMRPMEVNETTLAPTDQLN